MCSAGVVGGKYGDKQCYFYEGGWLVARVSMYSVMAGGHSRHYSGYCIAGYSSVVA